MDCYEVLEISPNSSSSDIGQAYRRLALKWHPDKQDSSINGKSAIEKFKAITQAYETLRDPNLRLLHDIELAKCQLNNPFINKIPRIFLSKRSTIEKYQQYPSLQKFSSSPTSRIPSYSTILHRPSSFHSTNLNPFECTKSHDNSSENLKSSEIESLKESTVIFDKNKLRTEGENPFSFSSSPTIKANVDATTSTEIEQSISNYSPFTFVHSKTKTTTITTTTTVKNGSKTTKEIKTVEGIQTEEIYENGILISTQTTFKNSNEKNRITKLLQKIINFFKS